MPPQPLSQLFTDLRKSLALSLSEILNLRNTREEKADASYVTQGDLLVDRIVQELVTNHLRSARVISEETANTEPSATSNWTVVIDPIDGTENFTSGMPEWGVSVACYESGRHAGSLIGCPEMNLWIQSGQAITRHQSRIRGLSSSLSKEDILGATKGFEYRILGCCVYNMINVIRGSFHSFENPKGAHTWDILAGLNLALEHGLNVTIDGQPYAGEYLPPTRKYRFKVENR